MQNRLAVLMTLLLGIFVGAALIYVTPLKYAQLIEPQIQDIPAEQFYQEYVQNKDKYIFLDVRGPEPYNNIHAEGALNQPLHTLYNERKNLPRNTEKEIILICSGGIASGVAYSYLEHYGFRNIKRIDGGIEAWIEAGLPVVSTVFNSQ
jgi:rhodanese-related sulfurtransferase